MTTTAADRQKAVRLRKKEPGKLSPEDSAWLDSYSASTKGRGRPPKTRSEPTVYTQPMTTQSVEVKPPSAEMPPPAAVPIADKPPTATIDFGAPQPAPPVAPLVAPQQCNIPNCPACRAAQGPAICLTTGKRVWPPMSEAGSEALAGAILSAIGFAISLFRKDKHFVKPTTDEIKRFGKHLREMALRRASWMGAIDDILAVFFVGGGYSVRALNQKPPKLEPSNDSSG